MKTGSRIGEEDADGEASGSAEAARLALQLAVGNRIRDVRKRAKMSQVECARKAGIDTSSMFRLEKGGQNATLDLLARVALALGVRIEELLVGIQPDPSIAVVRTRN